MASLVEIMISYLKDCGFDLTKLEKEAEKFPEIRDFLNKNEAYINKKYGKELIKCYEKGDKEAVKDILKNKVNGQIMNIYWEQLDNSNINNSNDKVRFVEFWYDIWKGGQYNFKINKENLQHIIWYCNIDDFKRCYELLMVMIKNKSAFSRLIYEYTDEKWFGYDSNEKREFAGIKNKYGEIYELRNPNESNDTELVEKIAQKVLEELKKEK